jgi:hypothetical protein
MLASLIAAIAVAAQTPAPDAAPVVAAERAFAADFPALGLAGSFTRWSTPDAVILTGGEARTAGRRERANPASP